MEIKDKPVLKNTFQTFTIKSNASWYKRLWFILSNPIIYIFTGKIRW